MNVYLSVFNCGYFKGEEDIAPQQDPLANNQLHHQQMDLLGIRK